MDSPFPDIWNINESLLDKHFIGQWEITALDNYKTPKAGKSQTVAMVRSKVNMECGDGRGMIRLYSYVPNRQGIGKIEMDGSIGICGTVTERVKMTDNFARVDFLFLRAIHPDDIIR